MLPFNNSNWYLKNPERSPHWIAKLLFITGFWKTFCTLEMSS